MKKINEYTRSEALKDCRQLRVELRNLKKAVRCECYDCMGGQKKTDCGLNKCPLYPYRPWAVK